MSEPMSEERRRGIEDFLEYCACYCPAYRTNDSELCIGCMRGKLERVCALKAADMVGYLISEIGRLKQQLHQQSDLIARMESHQKGGFW